MKPRTPQPSSRRPAAGARLASANRSAAASPAAAAAPARRASGGRRALTVIGILAVLGVGAYFAKPYLHPFLEEKLLAEEPGIPPLPGSYNGSTVKGEEWQSPETLRARLGEEILKRLKGTDKHSVVAFLNERENRLLLAQWQLATFEIQSADAIKARAKKVEDKSNQLKKRREELLTEQRTANSVRAAAINRQLAEIKDQLAEQEELAAETESMAQLAATPEGSDLLGRLTNNLDWVEQMVYTGECVQPGRAVALMAEMLRKDPQMLYNVLERDTLTATALEFALNSWPTKNALDRADYYITAIRSQRLNTVFDSLPFWQRRIVTGCKGENDFCSRESLEWALDHVHLPAEEYSGCCWRNGYKLYNLFGEIIHGSGYWDPFNGLFNNSMLFTSKVGAVCGGLSHFGAYSACANGIPALTAGEPGHCAFVLRVKDKWVPSYSLTWERSLHWTPWRNTWEYSSLHMADKLYSKGELKKTIVSNGYRSLAALFAEQKDKEGLRKALSCYNSAVSFQPANYLTWRDYAKLLSSTELGDKGRWKALNGLLCKKLAGDFPEMAAQILSNHVYPEMNKKLGDDDSERYTAFASFWKAVDGMGPDRWRLEQFLGRQLDFFKKNGKLTEDEKCNFYRSVLSTVAAKPVYATPVLAWGTKLSEGMGEAGKRKLMAATIESISGGEDLSADDRDKMLGASLRNAEQMRDIVSYRNIVSMLSKRYRDPDNKMPKFEPFPGKLWSREGMVYFSSIAEQYDNACSHPGLLTPGGGHFHTKNEENAWATVELPRLINVTGVVVVATPDHRNRLSGLRVQVSESGRDDDWKDVGQPAGKVPDRVTRFDLQAEMPRARYVRILRPGKNFMHLNGIYVYGKQSS